MSPFHLPVSTNPRHISSLQWSSAQRLATTSSAQQSTSMLSFSTLLGARAWPATENSQSFPICCNLLISTSPYITAAMELLSLTTPGLVTRGSSLSPVAAGRGWVMLHTMYFVLHAVVHHVSIPPRVEITARYPSFPLCCTYHYFCKK